MPVVVLLALAATRLVTLNLVHHRTLAAYQAGDQTATRTWGERQGWVNLVESFRSPFAIGDAHVLGGRFEAARPWFEQAFEQVSKGGLDDCKVRVNLGLTYEALGDAAKARERTAEWKQFYAKGLTITRERPKLCDAPTGGTTGAALRQTQQRLQDKSKGADTAPPPAQPPPSGPPTSPTPDPQPGPQQLPSDRRQQLLKEEQQRNTTERNRQTDGQDQAPPGDDGPVVEKPW